MYADLLSIESFSCETKFWNYGNLKVFDCEGVNGLSLTITKQGFMFL